MFGRKHPAVLIAGAGPAGLLGALQLAEHGVQVAIVDPSPTEEALRRRNLRHAVTLLHPRSLELLDRHGLGAAVLSHAREVKALGVYWQGERVAELSFERLARTRGLRCMFGAVVALADLERCLSDALRRQRVDVCYARRLARIEQGSGRVRVTLEHLGSDSAGYATAHGEMVVEKTEELDLDFVLAADGHRSVVRQQLDMSFEDVRGAERYEVFDGPSRQDLPEEAALVFADGASSVVWPLPGERWRWIVGPDAGARARSTARVPWLESAAGELEGYGHIDVDYSLASAFGKGRIWLAGGAAHATSPLGAQSVNMGLAEAAQVADILADALRGTRAPDAALASYARERSDEWARLLPRVGAAWAGLHPAADDTRRGAPSLSQIIPCLPTTAVDLDAWIAQLPSWLG